MLLSLITYCPLVSVITEISPLDIKLLFFKGLLLGRLTHSNWVSRSQRHDECGPGQTGPVCNVIPGIVERQQSHHCLSAAENTDLLILCRLHRAPPPDPLLCPHATFSPVCCDWKKKTKHNNLSFRNGPPLTLSTHSSTKSPGYRT